MADKDDDFYDNVTGMAERLGLKGDERRKYVHEHMTRGGYRMEPTYVPGDDGDDDDDGFFGSRKRSRTRNDDDDDKGGRTRNSKRKSSGSWWDD